MRFLPELPGERSSGFFRLGLAVGVLTDRRRERFAQALAAGKKPSAAYAWAGYEGDGGKRAGTLRRSDDIVERVQELAAEESKRVRAELRQIERRQELTRDYVLERLVSNVERAMQAEPVVDSKGIPTGVYKYEGSVANRALELLGKELGMFVDRKEIGVAGDFAAVKSSEELKQLIIDRLKLVAECDDEVRPLTVEGEVRSKADRLR